MNKSNQEILIVDDIPLNVQMLEEILSGEYTVHIANTGSDALTIAELHRPDLILLDIVMPEMDGFELFRRLRMIDALADVPVIFITMLDSLQNESSGLTLGAADYIIKPFQPEIVRLRVRNTLELKRQRTAELMRALAASEAANRAKSVFLSNMSHELRTPLNAVIGFADLLERDASLSAVNRDRANMVRKSGEHLLSIVSDVLEMSRIEAGRSELREQPLDLYTLLDDLAVMFRLRAEHKGLTFAVDVDADLPRYIVGDAGKLRQVLINLVSNAVKFTNRGSVFLRAEPAGTGRVAIEVQDTGIGIATKDIAKIFLPFEQLKSGLASHTDGLGLGLATSREHARLMGGDITVKCRVGKGSCFRFEFHAPLSTVAPPHVVSTFEAALHKADKCSVAPDIETPQASPTLEKMTPEWREKFKDALFRNNITGIRRLGEQAKEADPILAEWLLEHAGLYDIDGLKKLREDADKGGSHE